MRGCMFLQAAEIATISGKQDTGCTTADGTNSNAAPFPGERTLENFVSIQHAFGKPNRQQTAFRLGKPS